ncbi:MAG: YceI family protein [Deltaproteobacteria bacterium]|nr:YceI family protein [Deltaproteobacteria bacterium]
MSTTIDQNQGECVVFTFKEGLLSPVAHDLRLKVERWTVMWDATTRALEGRFTAGSVVVDAVMRDGRPAPGVLDAKDKAKIEKNMREDVLATARHPEVRFRASVPAGAAPSLVQGELELAGRTRPLSVQVRQDGASWVAEATIHQPDWGIKPYTAMLGTLKVKPDVRVRVTVGVDVMGQVG